MVTVTLDDADEPAAIAVELSTVSFCVTVYPIVEPAAVLVVLLTVWLWDVAVAADAVLIHKVRARVSKNTKTILFLFILPPPQSKYGITNQLRLLI